MFEDEFFVFILSVTTTESFLSCSFVYKEEAEELRERVMTFILDLVIGGTLFNNVASELR